jgi:hypothetical protein
MKTLSHENTELNNELYLNVMPECSKQQLRELQLPQLLQGEA